MAAKTKTDKEFKQPNPVYTPAYETRGTRTDIGNPLKLQCEAQGGFWDEASQTCRFPKVDFSKGLLNQPKQEQPAPLIPLSPLSLPKGKGTPIERPSQEQQQEQQVKTPEYFRDAKTGRLSGIVLPDGRAFLGLSPDQVNEIANREFEKTQVPIGTQPVGTAANAIRQQQETQRVISQLTGEPMLTEADLLAAVPQEPFLEKTQALGAGVIGAATGGGAAAVGAKLGAAGGSIVPVLGTAAGALIGAIGGYYGKISYDKRQDVKQANKVGNIANTNFGQIIDAVNAGLIPNDIALRRWQENRIALYAARANLKRETDTDLNRFLSNGADELARIEDFITDLETIKTQEFYVALATPNPSNIKYSYINRESLENE